MAENWVVTRGIGPIEVLEEVEAGASGSGDTASRLLGLGPVVLLM